MKYCVCFVPWDALNVVQVLWDAKLFVNLRLLDPKLVLTPRLHGKHILCRGIQHVNDCRHTCRRWSHPPVHLFAASTATVVCWPATEQGTILLLNGLQCLRQDEYVRTYFSKFLWITGFVLLQLCSQSLLQSFLGFQSLQQLHSLIL